MNDYPATQEQIGTIRQGRIYYRGENSAFHRIDNVQSIVVMPVTQQNSAKVATPQRYGICYQTEIGIKEIMAVFTIRQAAEMECDRILKILHDWDGAPMIVEYQRDVVRPVTFPGAHA